MYRFGYQLNVQACALSMLSIHAQISFEKYCGIDQVRLHAVRFKASIELVGLRLG